MGAAAAVPDRLAARRPAAALLVLALLAASTLLVNRVLPGWAYPVWNAATAVALVALALWSGLSLQQLGLARGTARRAALVGLAGAASVALAYGVALAVPPLRPVFDDQRAAVGAGMVAWAALVRIPFGTVLLEEVAFRGVLPALLGGADLDRRWRWPPVLAASALFGLWHVLPSMALASSNAVVAAVFGAASAVVVPAVSVLTTAVAGVALCAWRRAGHGLLAPMLVHLATNSGGVLIAWSLQQ